jgi:hypothetical protein
VLGDGEPAEIAGVGNNEESMNENDIESKQG